ncbi:DUF4062 domain-containing protein [Halomonas sp. ATBC28]|uniref:HAD-IB family phosphatase n=1 Tax=Halomonas sp. ATBC28 TaxID=2545264 RepID=UPI00110D75F7|nr:HAD-IB family phosphatase [Halomonas sp. ATBC28]TMU23992.1 DUF4062 domain-containing protein [Halomonas sp. ATBC28]
MKAKVFVSSTYLDLKSTRESVCNALGKNMLEPVLFEKGGVFFDPDCPLDTSCYKRVSECDLYILIIGSRYGSRSSQLEILDDVGTCEFNSVTREEWVEAKRNDIPIYIFVKLEVLSEYHIYKKQDSRKYKCVNVDDVNVFRLIDEIYSEKMNNLVQPYEKPEHIVNFFLQQSSGLLKKFLDDRRSSRSANIEKRDYFIDCYKLYYYRCQKKITQAELASEVGCDLRWLRKVENEKRHTTVFHMASMNEISALESNLGLEPGELIGSSSLFHEEKYKSFYYINKKKKPTYDASMDRDKKVVVFDFDGTLTIQDNGHSTWEKLWIELGYEESECIRYHKKFTAGEINHSEWCQITKEKFNDKAISQKNLINVANSIKLIDGVSELLKKLHAEGIAIYILSGSIEFIIRSVLGENVKYIKEISSNDLIFDASKLSRIVGTEYDFEGKAEFIKMKIRHHGIPANEVLFVGNSNNDVHAFESNAIILLINPVKVDPYSRCWTYNENKVCNLMAIEKYIFPSLASANN